MKNQFFGYLAALIFLVFLVHLPGRLGYVAKHPTLNKEAELPIIHMKNVGHYLNAEEMERSISHLQKAISAIKNLKRDVDTKSLEGLEKAINELEAVNDEFWSDTIDVSNMYHAFEYSLNNLAHAELEVSEMYIRSNDQKRAKIALKYARLHIRNALLFQKSIYDPNSAHVQIGQNVFTEIDSLIALENFSNLELSAKIDDIIKEVDALIVNP